MLVHMFEKARPLAAGLVLAFTMAACGDDYGATGPVGGPLASGGGAASSVHGERTTILFYDHGMSTGGITIPAGTAVEWRNSSAVVHTVSNYSTHPQQATWEDALLEPGEDFVHVFDQPGEYGFVCSFHQDVGYITVVAPDMGDMDDMMDGMDGMDDMMDGMDDMMDGMDDMMDMMP